MPSLISTRFDAATLERLDEAANALDQTVGNLIIRACAPFFGVDPVDGSTGSIPKKKTAKNKDRIAY